MQIVCDISFWQATFNAAIFKTKADGVILRAGQGSWEDKCFRKFRDSAKDTGLPYGSYWYFSNSHHPKRQAELWAETLGDSPGTLGAWIDLEQDAPGSYKNWQSWYDCMERFKELQPNVSMGVYTRASYFDELIGGNYSYFAKHPLWVAHYKTSKPDLPKGWDNWLMWQYTDEGDGYAHGVGSRELDMNHYNGDIPEVGKRYSLEARYGGKVVRYERNQ